MPNNIDPYRVYIFKLEIKDITKAHFTDCSGLAVSVKPIKYREAGNNQIVRHIPAYPDFAPVTLRYGFTSSSELWKWMLTAIQGKVDRKNVSVIMIDSSGEGEMMRWNLIDAWPSEWRGAPLDAMKQEIAIESLTLVFDTLERK